MITTLKIEGISCYAFHGCMEEETRIGGHFSVDVIINMDLSIAVTTDQLSYTADYADIHTIVQKEMAIPSKLIEHVAGRIAFKIKEKYSGAEKISVFVSKFNPPVNGFIQKAVVEVTV